MATGQRGFRELDISISSAVSSDERFPPAEDYPGGPEIFRSNLTALSQYYNLYFVAIGTDIHVYRPQFPSQRLSAQSACVIPLPFVGEQRPGCINPYNPHAANHIVVGDLGTEEILVCACDDGDVFAFPTRSLAFEIVQRESGKPGFAWGQRPFFHASVDESAWGIAIHKEARLIAVSSNTLKITVYAFALSQNGSPESSQGSAQDSELSEDIEKKICSEAEEEAGPPGLARDRSRDQVIILNGHACNIPSIAFCNTEDDPIGEYLISMDIKGVVVVWRLFEGTAQRYTSEEVADKHGIPHFDDEVWHGWNVICLNPRSFRPMRSELEMLGCEGSLNWGGASWNIGRSQRHVTDSSRWEESVHLPIRPGLIPRRLAVPNYSIQEEGEDDDEGETGEITEDTSSSDGSSLPLNRPAPLIAHPTSIAGPTLTARPTPITRQILRGHPPVPRPLLRGTYPPGQHPPPVPLPVFMGYTPPVNLDTYVRPPPRPVPPPRIPCSPVPFFLLTCSTTTPTLWSPNTISASIPTRATYLKHIITPRLPSSHPRLQCFDRLNMSLQIPALGVVIIASPIGRAALLSLTCERQRTDRCAFRLDWLLPFRGQELRDERPYQPLLGIAVSPVQGSGSRPKKWRLMMTYSDYTVLSYEIWRGEEGEGEVLVF
ncbi:hypothetical protein MMC11_004643 [Xylographa trunciseda]|nr:hypothetical protein [Xylographa trunciseda]